MAKIAVDPGHGVNTPGKRTPVAVAQYGRVVREYEFNKPTAQYLKAALERQGHTVVWTGGDSDPSLSARCKKANDAKADLFISVHYNAGGGHGVETYIIGRGGNAEKLANRVQPEMVKVRNQRNRGVKVANFHVLRETKMPAILVECGFMDDPRGIEQSWMLDKEFQKGMAEAICKGVQVFYGRAYKAETKPQPAPKPDYSHLPVAPGGIRFTRDLRLTSPHTKGDDVKAVQTRLNKDGAGLKVDGDYGPITEEAVKTYQKKNGLVVDGWVGPKTWTHMFSGEGGTAKFRVQAGAFSQKANADTRVKALKSKGFDAFAVKEGNLYRVQAGAFAERKNAEDRAAAIRKAGIEAAVAAI